MSTYVIRRSQLPPHPLQRLIFISLRDWRVSAYSLVGCSALLILLGGRVHGDEYTGLSKDDPKELISAPSHSTPAPTISSLFLPMPGWAGGLNSLATPDVLSPMGKKKEVAAAAKPEPLAPPKETPAVFVPKPEVTETPKQPEQPALIAVSPFLQWVKSNPQAAAAEAKAQAAASNPAPAATGPVQATGPAPGDPYWLPPLIDSSAFTPGSSAAIYTTPQR